MRRLVVAVSVAVLVTAAAAVVEAASVAEEAAFEHAVGRYEEGDFAGAIVELTALDKTPDRDLQLRAKLCVGMAYLGLDDKARAKEALTALLQIDPDFNLPPFSSPVVRAFFAEVRAAHVVVPVLEHAPPLEVEALSGVTLTVHARHMREGYALNLFYRIGTEARFSAIDVAERAEKGRFEVRLPAAFVVADASTVLQYYFLVDAHGEPLASLRSEKRPYEVPITAPKIVKAPVHQQWWFWTALAAGAAVITGAAVGGALYAKSRSPSDATVTVRF
ncbi:MAG: hypothetical protein IT381_20280 [Deltaproteobacteria bacterium]|nr:hypothetical protein [Deltaproteobacteria bacterium]